MEAGLAHYADLYDFAPTGYLTFDGEGTIRQVNLNGARLLGIERSGLLNRRFGQFVAESDRRAFSDFLQKVFVGTAKESCEVMLPRGDSQPLIVQIEATRSVDGQECRAVMLDITAHKRAEEEQARLETQLQQAQKMESVGRLAGGVAHDFNNMLSVILGHAELALAQVDLTQPLHADLEEIRKAAMRSADLTRQLLAFARKQTVAPRVLDLNDTVAGMINMLRRLIGENVDLQWRPAADLWPVNVDPSQIDQILANLCVNARDAISGVGKVTIETGNTTFDERYCAANVGCNPGDYVLLALSDDGCGMDKDTVSHLFEPFFTTKVMGKGTGLGLATIYGIVKQNSGSVNVYSEPNLGTTFKIYLPRHAGKAAEARTEGPTKPTARGQETILLVEDEPAILTLTKRMLEQQGYSVLAASTPGGAKSLAKEHAGEIHLLMTDVVMPEMNGRILARNLLYLYPRMKRLFMSGYTADVIAHQGVLDEGVHFVQKPFSTEELATKVRNALDAED
ncbi:MAG: ATP-binding protein [Acidobacteria bacterium]|nr:ATP-binding protein [Acidobacteriota bacterium]